MSTTHVRVRNRGVSGPSVVKLVKHFESLSDNSSLVLRGTIMSDGGAGEAGARKRGPVARPLQSRDDLKDVRTHSLHIYGACQQKLLGHRGSGDHLNNFQNVSNFTRGGLQTSTVRFYDRCGIEHASPETRQTTYHRRRLRTDNVTASASASKTTTSDHRDNSTRVVVAVVVVVHAGSEKPIIGTTAVDVGNNSTTTTTAVPRQIQVKIELDDFI
ncbi:hypothetical protein ACI65C_012275 [Semiaphis heraclei]